MLLVFAASAESDTIRIQATAVPLSAADPALERVGALAFRGGLVLISEDRRFGGLSGLHVSPDGGRLLAVTDQGNWLFAHLGYDGRGYLTSLSAAELGAMRDPKGKPLEDKAWADAESLAMLEDGSAIVGFERHHRLWRYRGERPGIPEVFPAPPGIERAPPNEGLEALAALKDGGLLGITEQMSAGRDGFLQGFLWRGGQWSTLSYRAVGTPRPSDATALPSGDVLVLERAYSPVQGLLLRLRRIARTSIEPGAVLDPPILAELRPPLTVENFEGIAVRQVEKQTLVYLVSDDNFSTLQKTLLLMFALTGEGSPAAESGKP